MKFKLIMLLVTLLPLWSGCNNEDDIDEIFMGKTWRLSDFYRTDNWKHEGKAEMTQADREVLKKNRTGFFIAFTEGEVSGRGINSTFKGTWRADGKSNVLSMYLTVTGKETEPLAVKFIDALQTAQFYRGDANLLKIFYGGKNDYVQFFVE